MYGIAESLYCTPETNITVYVNCSSIKKNNSSKIPINGLKIFFVSFLRIV